MRGLEDDDPRWSSLAPHSADPINSWRPGLPEEKVDLLHVAQVAQVRESVVKIGANTPVSRLPDDPSIGGGNVRVVSHNAGILCEAGPVRVLSAMFIRTQES